MKCLTTLIVVVTFAASALAMAAPTAAPQNTWERLEISPYDTVYSITEQNVYCSVQEKADGSLNVFAQDSNWRGKTVTHYVSISKRGYVDGFTFATEKSGAMVLGKGYLVFDLKCSAKAKELPLEVRKKFNGAYGIASN